MIRLMGSVSVCMLLLFSAVGAAITGLNPGGLSFTTGTTISDQPDDRLIAVPNSVCYDVYPKAPAMCQKKYANWYLGSGLTDPVTQVGTINITLAATNAQDLRPLMVMVGGLTTTSLLVDEDKQLGGIQGFNEDAIVLKHDGSYNFTQPGEVDFNIAYTSMQIGETLYGKSLWVHQDKQTGVVGINAYEAVGWDLEPAGGLPLGINAMGDTLTQLQDTLLTEKVEVNSGGTMEKSRVVIRGSATFQGKIAEGELAGLEVHGDVELKRLYGKFGIVDAKTVTESIQSNSLFNNTPASITGPHLLFEDELSSINTFNTVFLAQFTLQVPLDCKIEVSMKVTKQNYCSNGSDVIESVHATYQFGPNNNLASFTLMANPTQPTQGNVYKYVCIYIDKFELEPTDTPHSNIVLDGAIMAYGVPIID